MATTKTKKKLKSPIAQFFLIYFSLILSSELSRLVKVYVLLSPVDKSMLFFVHLQLAFILLIPNAILMFLVFKFSTKLNYLKLYAHNFKLLFLSVVIFGFVILTFDKLDVVSFLNIKKFTYTLFLIASSIEYFVLLTLLALLFNGVRKIFLKIKQEVK